MSLRVGFVGLGTMGAPMARNLARRGLLVGVASRTRAKADALAEALGVPAHDGAANLAAEVDVLVSCVPDAPEVEQVHLGSGGTREGAARRASGAPRLVVVDCSTIAAESWRSIAGALGAAGVDALDAPVSGGQKGAVEATLSFFVGGAAEVLAFARPAFDAMGSRVTHLGPVGSGQLGKATNQILVAINLMAVCESLAFAEKVGLPLEALHQALVGGAARSWALEVLGQKILDGDLGPAFAVRHQQKDLAIVLDTARAARAPLPGASLVHQLLGALEARGLDDEGTQALSRVYRALGGLDGFASDARPAAVTEAASR